MPHPAIGTHKKKEAVRPHGLPCSTSVPHAPPSTTTIRSSCHAALVPTRLVKIMQTINVRQLKTDPSPALHDSHRDLVVVVVNRDRPDAVLIGFEQLDGLADFAHAR